MPEPHIPTTPKAQEPPPKAVTLSDASQQAAAVGAWTKMIGDNGAMIVIVAVFLCLITSGGFLALWYWKRRLSGEHIAKDDVLAYVRKEHPSVLKPDIAHLPDLKDHPCFAACTKQIRSAEALVMTVTGDGPSAMNARKVATDLARDLVIWTLRAYRDGMHELVVEGYEHATGLNGYLGDAARFRSLVDGRYTAILSAVRYRLVTEFNFPAEVYDHFQAYREPSDEVMGEMLGLAASTQTEAYWRLKSSLDSVYARALSFRDLVEQFLFAMGTERLAHIIYERGAEASQGTMAAVPAQKGSEYPAALFERQGRRKGGW